MHTHLPTCTWTHMYLQVYSHICTYIHMNTHIPIGPLTHMYLYASTWMHIYLCAHKHICIYMHMSIHVPTITWVPKMYGLQGDLGGEANDKKKKIVFFPGLLIFFRRHYCLESHHITKFAWAARKFWMFICGLGNHYWTLLVSVCRCMCGVCV